MSLPVLVPARMAFEFLFRILNVFSGWMSPQLTENLAWSLAATIALIMLDSMSAKVHTNRTPFQGPGMAKCIQYGEYQIASLCLDYPCAVLSRHVASLNCSLLFILLLLSRLPFPAFSGCVIYSQWSLGETELPVQALKPPYWLTPTHGSRFPDEPAMAPTSFQLSGPAS